MAENIIEGRIIAEQPKGGSAGVLVQTQDEQTVHILEGFGAGFDQFKIGDYVRLQCAEEHGTYIANKVEKIDSAPDNSASEVVMSEHEPSQTTISSDVNQSSVEPPEPQAKLPEEEPENLTGFREMDLSSLAVEEPNFIENSVESPPLAGTPSDSFESGDVSRKEDREEEIRTGHQARILHENIYAVQYAPDRLICYGEDRTPILPDSQLHEALMQAYRRVNKPVMAIRNIMQYEDGSINVDINEEYERSRVRNKIHVSLSVKVDGHFVEESREFTPNKQNSLIDILQPYQLPFLESDRPDAFIVELAIKKDGKVVYKQEIPLTYTQFLNAEIKYLDSGHIVLYASQPDKVEVVDLVKLGIVSPDQEPEQSMDKTATPDNADEMDDSGSNTNKVKIDMESESERGNTKEETVPENNHVTLSGSEKEQTSSQQSLQQPISAIDDDADINPAMRTMVNLTARIDKTLREMNKALNRLNQTLVHDARVRHTQIVENTAHTIAQHIIQLRKITHKAIDIDHYLDAYVKAFRRARQVYMEALDGEQPSTGIAQDILRDTIDDELQQVDEIEKELGHD